jgi:hypothetical protein
VTSTRDAFRRDLGDASRGPGAPCDWCERPIPAGRRADAEVCDVVCRKRRWRFERAVLSAGDGDASRGDRAAAGTRARGPDASRPSTNGTRAPAPARRDASLLASARFAYADPPYPGKSALYPEGEEVDHASLLEQLVAGYPDGWALSTSAAALRDVLLLCPPAVRVCVWRRGHRGGRAEGPLNAWEPLIVYGGRSLLSDVPHDVVDVLDYRGRFDSFPGALIGMKPPQFSVWMFALLGARAGDQLDDLYPGSGAVGRAWQLYTSLGPAAVARDGCSRPQGRVPELGDARDASPVDELDGT